MIPRYKRGQSCLQRGYQSHFFVDRGTYKICTRCGSKETYKDGAGSVLTAAKFEPFCIIRAKRKWNTKSMLNYFSNIAVPKGFYEFELGSPTPKKVGQGTRLLFSVRGAFVAQCLATTGVEKMKGKPPRIGISDFKVLFGFPERLILNRALGRGLHYPTSRERERLEQMLRLKSMDDGPRRIRAHLKSVEAKSRDFQQWLKREELKRFGAKCILCDTNLKSLLRASHIVPVADNLSEAGNVNNALLPCVLHDALFENGLIAISASGNVDVTPSVDWGSSNFLSGIRRNMLSRGVIRDARRKLKSSARFLGWHKRRNFQKQPDTDEQTF